MAYVQNKSKSDGVHSIIPTDNGIAWPSDVEQKFKFNEEYSKQSDVTTIGQYGQTLPLVTDESFMVWMRYCSFSLRGMKLKYISFNTILCVSQNCRTSDVQEAPLHH